MEAPKGPGIIDRKIKREKTKTNKLELIKETHILSNLSVESIAVANCYNVSLKIKARHAT